MFAALSELSCQVLCLDFKSKLLRQATALITQLSLLQTSKSKNTALRAKKMRSQAELGSSIDLVRIGING